MSNLPLPPEQTGQPVDSYLLEIREELSAQLKEANDSALGSDLENFNLMYSQALATFYLAEVTRLCK